MRVMKQIKIDDENDEADGENDVNGDRKGESDDTDEKDDENDETDGENDVNGGLHKRVTVLGSIFGKVLLPLQDNAQHQGGEDDHSDSGNRLHGGKTGFLWASIAFW